MSRAEHWPSDRVEAPASASHCVSPSIPALLAAALLLAVSGCAGRRAGIPLEMFDCQFQNKGLVHLHVSEHQASAHLLTRYRPEGSAAHADKLKAAVESRGKLVPPGGSRLRIEIFLRNDSFGERPSESVTLSIDADGRSRLEATLPGAESRVIDYGVCSVTDQHR